jgi:hypothetical protein
MIEYIATSECIPSDPSTNSYHKVIIYRKLVNRISVFSFYFCKYTHIIYGSRMFELTIKLSNKRSQWKWNPNPIDSYTKFINTSISDKRYNREYNKVINISSRILGIEEKLFRMVEEENLVNKYYSIIDVEPYSIYYGKSEKITYYILSRGSDFDTSTYTSISISNLGESILFSRIDFIDWTNCVLYLIDIGIDVLNGGLKYFKISKDMGDKLFTEIDTVTKSQPLRFKL